MFEWLQAVPSDESVRRCTKIHLTEDMSKMQALSGIVVRSAGLAHSVATNGHGLKQIPDRAVLLGRDFDLV